MNLHVLLVCHFYLISKIGIDFFYILRFIVTFNGSAFQTHYTVTYDTWVHAGLVFRGAADGEGIMIYTDGTLRKTITGRVSSMTGNPSGVLKIGRLFEGSEGRSSSAQVDELMFWNRQLSGDEIMTIKNMAL